MLDDAIFKSDFLDEAASDLPKGCWAVQEVDSMMTILRHNVWKGYLAYHKGASCEHGCVYVGDGLRNDDFAFM
jgi:hypothetical protein